MIGQAPDCLLYAFAVPEQCVFKLQAAAPASSWCAETSVLCALLCVTVQRPPLPPPHGAPVAAAQASPSAAAAAQADAASGAGPSTGPATHDTAAEPEGGDGRRPKACAVCGAARGGGTKLRVCTGCSAVWYCGPECQARHWKRLGHKRQCAALAAAHASGQAKAK